MKIDEGDLIKINEYTKKYKLEGTTEEIVNDFLTRCECCGEIAVKEYCKLIRNWDGKKIKICENCQNDEDFFDNSEKYIESIEDYTVDEINDERKIQGDY